MRVWLVTVVSLFLLVEFYQWVKGFFLPLPVYVLAGAFLAIASNYEQGITNLFQDHKTENEPLSQTATLVDPIPSEEESIITPQIEGSED